MALDYETIRKVTEIDLPITNETLSVVERFYGVSLSVDVERAKGELGLYDLETELSPKDRETIEGMLTVNEVTLDNRSIYDLVMVLIGLLPQYERVSIANVLAVDYATGDK